LLAQPRMEENSIKLNYKKINESFLNAQKKLGMIVSFVYSQECRFKLILEYFGEKLEKYRCSKCDNCLLEEKIPETSIQYLSEIILETLEEAETELTENSVINLLRGKAAKESFTRFSRFGSCRNFTPDEIKTAIHKLASLNKLTRSTGKVKYLHSNNINFEIASNAVVDKNQNKDYENDLSLFNELKAIRKKASVKFMQSGFLICPDEVLTEIVKTKPKNRPELLNIKNFNQRMFNKFGEDILETINAKVQTELIPAAKKKLPNNLSETYKMLSKKYTLREMAEMQKLTEAVISMQIETIIEFDPELDISYLVGKNNLEEIEKVYDKRNMNLKELKENLTQNIPYPLLRIAAAKLKFSSHL